MVYIYIIKATDKLFPNNNAVGLRNPEADATLSTVQLFLQLSQGSISVEWCALK